MDSIARRTLANYSSRHLTLVNKWKLALSDPDAPANLVVGYDAIGDMEVNFREPSALELAMFLQQDIGRKNTDFADSALLGEIGKSISSTNHRKYSSFESDRSALLYFFNEAVSDYPDLDFHKGAEIRQAISILHSMGVQITSLKKKKAIRRGEKTNRPKSFPESDWVLLASELTKAYLVLMEQKRVTNAMCAAIFISAGLSTGARPGEWTHASWANSERSAVRFSTSKQKVAPPKIFKNRPPMARKTALRHRVIDIDPSYQDHVERHFYYLDQAFEGCVTDEEREDAMDRYIKACGAAILSARKKVPEWSGDRSKEYTLYVTRSQFAALQSLLDPIRKHEKMGWSSRTTSASSYYGHAKDALGARGDVMHQTNALAPESLSDPFTDADGNAEEAKSSAASTAESEQPDADFKEAWSDNGVEGGTDDGSDDVPTRPRG